MRRAEARARDAGGPSTPSASERTGCAFVLYGRSYCHLCEEMLAELRKQLGTEIPVTVVDVDSDPVLAERYGERVPLLMCGETEISRYRLDAQKVAAHIGQSR